MSFYIFVLFPLLLIDNESLFIIQVSDIHVF